LIGEVILLLLLIFFAIFGALAVFFFVRMSMRIEQTAKHLDDILTQVEKELPDFCEQSKQTLKSLESTSNKTEKFVGQIQQPIQKLQSSGLWQAIVGMINGITYFRNVFGEKQQVKQDNDEG